MKTRNSKLPAGTFVERSLFESQAFLSLRGFSAQLLILFLGKRQRGPDKGRKGEPRVTWSNLSNLNMTYRELKEKHGVPIPRATRAIDDLLAKGFLEIRHQGGAYRQDKTVYALVDKWVLWRPGMVFSKRDPDVRRGYQNGVKN
jgi:hypothetical protein